jgi:hypothetical protein
VPSNISLLWFHYSGFQAPYHNIQLLDFLDHPSSPSLFQWSYHLFPYIFSYIIRINFLTGTISWTSRIQSPAMQDFVFSLTFKPNLGPVHSPILETHSLWVKLRGREAYSSLPSSAKVKKGRASFQHPPYAFIEQGQHYFYSYIYFLSYFVNLHWWFVIFLSVWFFFVV